GVTVEELAAANGMLNPDLIVTGDLLIVPSGPASAEALPEDSNPQTDVENTETAESTGNDEVAAPVLVTNDVRPQQPPTSVQAGAATLHLVLPGETVESIAEAYGVTVPQLLAANGQAQNGVSSGMILKVPPADTAGVQLVNMPAAIEMSAVGSELTAVSVATAYWGASISENTLLASLEMSDNPHLGFRGDINGQFGGTDDYGVYAAPLSEAVSEHGFIGEVFYADGDATQLTDRIDRGLPVVTWITYQTAQAEPQRVDDDVRPFTVVAGKQAVVAYGYDDQGVLVVDLASGGYSHINWADFMRSWNYFDGMGLAISPI
ncbi:MAG: C39 family peptidase, partial [Chloroflexia bacterium]|nr:C39 family peptidase [Chloroflexia bacterium]